MEVLLNLIETVIVAAFIAAVACGGILYGKKLRMKKNAEIAQETDTVEDTE